MSSPAPVTEAQLAANRSNAQNSTGPRTPQGKDRTRLNGLRHGLTGQTVVMPHEDRKAFERHVYHVMQSLHPETETEKDLARSIAHDQWRLNRARAIEENIFALGQVANPVLPEGALEGAGSRTCAALTQAQTFLHDAKQIGLLSLYESRIHRTLQRNMTELQRLQTERRAAQVRQLEEAMLLAQLAASEGRDYDPQQDGFGFSAPEIARHLDRARRLEEARELLRQDPVSLRQTRSETKRPRPQSPAAR